MKNIDYEKLREDLIDYFGSATPLYPVAYMDVIKVENASNEELIHIALKNNFDLEDYEYIENYEDGSRNKQIINKFK